MSHGVAFAWSEAFEDRGESLCNGAEEANMRGRVVVR